MPSTKWTARRCQEKTTTTARLAPAPVGHGSNYFGGSGDHERLHVFHPGRHREAAAQAPQDGRRSCHGEGQQQCELHTILEHAVLQQADEQHLTVLATMTVPKQGTFSDASSEHGKKSV